MLPWIYSSSYKPTLTLPLNPGTLLKQLIIELNTKLFAVKNILFISFFLTIALLTSSCKKEKNAEDETAISVGKLYDGGIIFYVDGSGEHGLIASETNITNSIRWNNGTYVVTGSIETSVGKGLENTTAIITAQGTGNYAASVCEDLTLNGKSDWFLPSKNELSLLYQQKNQIGGFAEGYYWCATEYDSLHAWNQYFPYGPQYYADKSDSACVRAIRAF